MDQHLITRIVEAALLAANQPLTLVQLHALFPLDEPAPADSVEQALETLREQSAGRGVELVEVASGFRFQVQADVHAWVARLWTERQTKYTRATLETLALIAYRQPITRGEIEQIRGVAVNSSIIKALEEREWIRVVGHRDMPGRPELLGTTKGFLDYFGLKRLDELPPLSELKDFGELEPQLQFDGAPVPIANIADMNDAPDATDADDAGAANGGARDADAPVDANDETASDAALATDTAPSAHSASDAQPPEHDTAREERADSDPSIADAGDDADFPSDEHADPALAEDGDSTRSTT